VPAVYPEELVLAVPGSSEFDRTRRREVLGRESGRLRKNVEMLFAHTNGFLMPERLRLRGQGVPATSSFSR
jgi:hypothetical protein